MVKRRAFAINHASIAILRENPRVGWCTPCGGSRGAVCLHDLFIYDRESAGPRFRETNKERVLSRALSARAWRIYDMRIDRSRITLPSKNSAPAFLPHAIAERIDISLNSKAECDR